MVGAVQEHVGSPSRPTAARRRKLVLLCHAGLSRRRGRPRPSAEARAGRQRNPRPAGTGLSPARLARPGAPVFVVGPLFRLDSNCPIRRSGGPPNSKRGRGDQGVSGGIRHPALMSHLYWCQPRPAGRGLLGIPRAHELIDPLLIDPRAEERWGPGGGLGEPHLPGPHPGAIPHAVLAEYQWISCEDRDDNPAERGRCAGTSPPLLPPNSRLTWVVAHPCVAAPWYLRQRCGRSAFSAFGAQMGPRGLDRHDTKGQPLATAVNGERPARLDTSTGTAEQSGGGEPHESGNRSDARAGRACHRRPCSAELLGHPDVFGSGRGSDVDYSGQTRPTGARSAPGPRIRSVGIFAGRTCPSGSMTALSFMTG